MKLDFALAPTTGFWLILSRTASAPNQTWIRDWESDMSETFAKNNEQFQILTVKLGLDYPFQA